MEKAVSGHQSSNFRPRVRRDSEGNMLMPHEDIYHLAMAHAPKAHATVLATLKRLDTRYARQFCTALRLLIALRRGDPPPAPETQPVEPKVTAREVTDKKGTHPISQPTM